MGGENERESKRRVREKKRKREGAYLCSKSRDKREDGDKLVLGLNHLM